MTHRKLVSSTIMSSLIKMVAATIMKMKNFVQKKRKRMKINMEKMLMRKM